MKRNIKNLKSSPIGRKHFEKDLRDYLTDVSEYDIKRIMQIYDRYDLPPVIQERIVHVTKIEKVYVPQSLGNSARVGNKILYAEINKHDILGICSSIFGIPIEDILYKRWNKERALCRHCVSYLLYKYTAMSLKEIGKFLGRDHTTVMNSRDIIRNVIEKEQEYGYYYIMSAEEEIFKLIKQRKDAKRNAESTIGTDTQNLQREGVLRQAI